MNLLSRVCLIIKAIRELGARQLSFYAVYQAGLRLGFYRLHPQPAGVSAGEAIKKKAGTALVRPLLPLPEPDELLDLIGEPGLFQLRTEADEIVKGQVRLFGRGPVLLDLSLPGSLKHWTAYETGKADLPLNGKPDIKFIWEPARLGWAFTLARAYYLTGEEDYAAAFWHNLEKFWAANPPYQGPNWISGQEAALRILALVFSAQIFAHSLHSTTTRLACLAASLVDHARRIPPTLNYARAQNNNHLLSEAAGLVTAALALPDHPLAIKWCRLGQKCFTSGLASQIKPDGTYTQHSTNYHRLVLQLALWVQAIQPLRAGEGTSKLRAATSWLLTLTDPDTGGVPNLGPNDGAYILPLSVLPFQDYRPVIQAASRTFSAVPAFQPGIWDEMGCWLGIPALPPLDRVPARPRDSQSPMVLAHPSGDSWAYLRAAHFDNRPGHADQLHLDLWWRGMNIAQDAGTYLYNGSPPWQNALTHTAVHNTVMVDDVEHMTRAGRFLYVDRAQAFNGLREYATDGTWQRMTAWHHGYQRLGLRHTRVVTAQSDGAWEIVDDLQPTSRQSGPYLHEIRLHWLLPDWEYEFLDTGCGLRLQSPLGCVTLQVAAYGANRMLLPDPDLSITRAGSHCFGSGPSHPTWGWVSPTYGVKEPALSTGFLFKAGLPLTLVTTWRFPHG